MKRSIAWHEQILDNLKWHLSYNQTELDKLKTRVAQSRAKIRLYSAQICAAKKAGRDSFDADRYVAKKRR